MNSKLDDNPTHTPTAPHIGRVKWFNNKAGYGFTTICSEVDRGRDIFIHHSGIRVGTEQYKYLVQGEYVSFFLKSSGSSDHPYQATDLTGVNGGKLMCETRNEMRTIRMQADREGGQPNESNARSPRRAGGHRGDHRSRVRPHGGGPRGGGQGDASGAWHLKVKSDQEHSVSASHGPPPS